MKIKKYEDYSKIKELRYSIFDYDDNLLYMPSIVHLDLKKGDKWIPIDIPSSDFNEYIQNGRTRMRNGNYQETFCEQSDKGPRGNKAFLEDSILAIKSGDFGPSWVDFIHSLVDGRIFLIITARGHEPETMKKTVKWIIYNYLSENQRNEMIGNLMMFQRLFGDEPEDAIEHYLNLCDFVGVMSNYFKKHFKTPDMKVSQLVGYGKSLAIKRFLNRIREYSKQVGIPAKVGFSDDRVKTLRDVAEFLSGEKSLDVLDNHNISYYLFDTSGKEKKKIKI